MTRRLSGEEKEERRQRRLQTRAGRECGISPNDHDRRYDNIVVRGHAPSGFRAKAHIEPDPSDDRVDDDEFARYSIR